MLTKTPEEKEIKKIYRSTIKSMESIGTYRPEFNPTIMLYAQMKQQCNKLTDDFYQGGCKITEQYTNKAGFTNIRKTALYLSLETLRKDITNHEILLGLNPVGLKKIKSNNVTKKPSKMEKALNDLGK